jgi:aspartate racemase
VKTLGLVGGIGPESTIAYYRAIMAAARAGRPDRGQPPILINSIDVQKVLRLTGTHALRELTEYLVEEVERQAAAARATRCCGWSMCSGPETESMP